MPSNYLLRMELNNRKRELFIKSAYDLDIVSMKGKIASNNIKLTTVLKNSIILCPWCNIERRYNDNKHFNSHYFI